MTSKIQEQRDYYALCAEARKLGIPVSLDDPDSPPTVDELRGMVAAAKERRDFYGLA